MKILTITRKEDESGDDFCERITNTLSTSLSESKSGDAIRVELSDLMETADETKIVTYISHVDSILTATLGDLHNKKVIFFYKSKSDFRQITRSTKV